jgi:Xaa-Pro aminopeptidase
LPIDEDVLDPALVAGEVAAVATTRRGMATEMMKAIRVDHLLLGKPDNIRYVSDLRTLLIHETADWALALFGAEGDTDLFAPWVRDVFEDPFPELPHVRSIRPVPGWVPIMSEPAFLVQSVANALRAARAHTVGYDAVHPELVSALRRELPNVTFQYIGNDLFQMRSKKTLGEIALMERAHFANLAALERAWSVAIPGATDYELLAESMKQMQLDGAEMITHFTCSVRPEFATWYPKGKRIGNGEAVFIDQVYYGQGGYASDLTRTVFVGEPAPEVLAAYGRLIDARRVVEQAARPGMRVSQLDELMNNELESRGLRRSPYALGHGIGLLVCEPPAITEAGMVSDDVRLREGQTIALEPETVYEYRGSEIALKIEDCFVVEKDGLRGLGPLASLEGCVLA